MGFFDKKTKNSTVNNDYAYDQSTHITDQSLNENDNSIHTTADFSRQFEDNSDNSLSVDQVDNSDNSIYSNYENEFSDYSDNSLAVEMVDDSQSSYSDSSSRNLLDYSDNSLTVAMTDNTGSQNSGNSSFTNQESFSSSVNTTNSTNITDGGAFSVIDKMIGKVVDGMQASQLKMIDLVGINQAKTLAASNDLAGRSLDASMAIKKSEIDGGTVTGIATMASGALKVAAVAGLVYAAAKIWGKK